MSDTSPRDQRALLWNATPTAAPAAAKPRELLFTFERHGHRWTCELLDHGLHGVEAQFARDGDFNHSRRFDPSLSVERNPRELAIAWAEEERRALERATDKT